MRKYKRINIIYFVTTILVFLFEGIVPALTWNTELAIEGVRHLGYPDYFRVILTGFKLLGALVLIVPFVKRPAKEWAYAGFTFTMIAAFVSHWVVDGFNGQAIFPLFFLAILLTSYTCYQKLLLMKNENVLTSRTDNYVFSSIS